MWIFFPNMCLRPSTELWNFLFKEVQFPPFHLDCDTVRWFQWMELACVPSLSSAFSTEAQGLARNRVQFYPLLVVAIPNVPKAAGKKKLLIRNSLNFPPCLPAFVFLFTVYSQSSSPITEKSGQGCFFSGLSLSALGEEGIKKIKNSNSLFRCIVWKSLSAWIGPINAWLQYQTHSFRLGYHY